MTPSAPQRRRSRSLTDDVVAALSEQIRAGRYRPGAKLPTESAIMSEQSVSRTVVREAISRLQAAGLVETRHGIGTFVMESDAGHTVKLAASQVFTMLDTMAVLELRISIETEAAALAASRRSDNDLQSLRTLLDEFRDQLGQSGGGSVPADQAFHLRIAQATGNQYFLDILGQLGKNLIPRTRIDTAHLAADDQQNYLRRVNQEHEDIFFAIERGDPEAARAAMRTHLSNSRERLRKAYERMTREPQA
ncbi:FadR family transcriptional regulator [Candidimonas humi]|uniref:FadR/GntR family transcriptional regulator n=1 Tax=Candidimonas humi TaxID=683355 RepID=A0ABV8NUZ9_9BURK|nr:FadR/GntR family transcriptional regulator [Candidimonas humi]MBV6305901.1 FadR family transcriptional regulator [Candidimonas humi]